MECGVSGFRYFALMLLWGRFRAWGFFISSVHVVSGFRVWALGPFGFRVLGWFRVYGFRCVELCVKLGRCCVLGFPISSLNLFKAGEIEFLYVCLLVV